MILFIHIPKTAGTSFRQALEKAHKKKNLTLDYGEHSPETSDIVRQYLHGPQRKQPRKELLETLEANDCAALAGHFPYRKYGWFFRPGDIVSFVREPLHRLASEYLHRQRLHSYDESFETFIELPGHQNRQSVLLDGLPAKAFVGITERYQDSLQLLGHNLGTTFRANRRNVAPHGGATEFIASLSSNVIRRMRQLNEQDIALYEHRRSVLELRYAEQYPAEA